MMTNPPKRIWAFEEPDSNIPRAGDWIEEQSETPEGSLEYVLADPGFEVMRITDQASGEVYWLGGHDLADAHESFGQDIDVLYLWACGGTGAK